MNTLHFSDKGSGQALVLLHGFCETGRIWDRFAAALSDEYRVLVPDLPGFGDSPLLETPFSIDDLGGVLNHWMAEQRLSRPVVIGHSLGGYVALSMAVQAQESLAAIGLFHSTALADTEEKKTNRNKTIDFVRRNGVDPFVATFCARAFFQKNNEFVSDVFTLASQTSPETLMAYAEAMRDRPSRESWLATFRKPILLIAGERDNLISEQSMKEQAELARIPFYRCLTDVGHMGFFEKEAESLKIVRDFMRFASNQTA